MLVFSGHTSHVWGIYSPLPLLFSLRVEHGNSFLLLHVVIFSYAIFSLSSLLPTKEAGSVIIVLC